MVNYADAISAAGGWSGIAGNPGEYSSAAERANVESKNPATASQYKPVTYGRVSYANGQTVYKAPVYRQPPPPPPPKPKPSPAWLVAAQGGDLSGRNMVGYDPRYDPMSQLLGLKRNEAVLSDQEKLRRLILGPLADNKNGNLDKLSALDAYIKAKGTSSSKAKGIDAALAAKEKQSPRTYPKGWSENGAENAARVGARVIGTDGLPLKHLRYTADTGGYRFASDSDIRNDPTKTQPVNGFAPIEGELNGTHGMWVYEPGTSSLFLQKGKNVGQSDVWNLMGNDERSDYIRQRAILRDTEPDSEIHMQALEKATFYSTNAQLRLLNMRYEEDKTNQNAQAVGGFFSDKLGTTEYGITGTSPNFGIFKHQIQGKPGEAPHYYYEIKSAEDIFDSVRAEVMSDHETAGEVMALLARSNFIPSGGAKYLDQFVEVRNRPDGTPVFYGVWNSADYDKLLGNAIKAVITQQNALNVPGQPVPDVITMWRDLADDSSAARGGGGGGGYSSGGGGGYGGYRRYYGGGGGYYGGGGGGGNRVFLTDPTELAATIDGIARARLGRVLTAQEHADFVAYFHGLERQYSAAYTGGGEATQPSAEGQAVAWIEKYFMGEQIQETQGEYVGALIQWLLRGGTFGGSTS